MPGLGDSPPDHWQSLWERGEPAIERVVQRDSLDPDRDEWIDAVEAIVLARPGRCVLIGHSLGCGTIAQWAHLRSANRCVGAFLVAPSDIPALPYQRDVATFLPMPAGPLPFPSLVVTSDNDPYVTLAKARTFAAEWGSRIVEVPDAGHIYAESGHGPWPEGLALLDGFIHDLEREEL